MKKTFFLPIFLFICSSALSQGLGVGAGPSFWTVNDIYIKQNDLNLIDKNKKAGLNLNARIKLGSENLKYVFNAGWNRFTIESVKFTDNRNLPETTYELKLSQNIFPLSAGLELGIPVTSTRLYACGDVVYNIIKNSIDYVQNVENFSIGIPVIFGDKSTFRIGASVGAGFEFKIAFLMMDINARLHYLNLLNKDTDETTTSFLMTNITIFFIN